MQEKIDFWYFCLYNYFYRDGIVMENNYKGSSIKVIPEIRACIIFSGIIYFLSILIRCIYKCFLNHDIIIFMGEFPYTIIIEFVLVVMVFYFFYKQYVSTKKYLKLYIRYKTTSYKVQSKITNTFIWLFVLLAILPFFFLYYWFDIIKNSH